MLAVLILHFEFCIQGVALGELLGVFCRLGNLFDLLVFTDPICL